jgi:hypothetical protein
MHTGCTPEVQRKIPCASGVPPVYLRCTRPGGLSGLAGLPKVYPWLPSNTPASPGFTVTCNKRTFPTESLELGSITAPFHVRTARLNCLLLSYHWGGLAGGPKEAGFDYFRRFAGRGMLACLIISGSVLAGRRAGRSASILAHDSPLERRIKRLALACLTRRSPGG